MDVVYKAGGDAQSQKSKDEILPAGQASLNSIEINSGSPIRSGMTPQSSGSVIPSASEVATRQTEWSNEKRDRVISEVLRKCGEVPRSAAGGSYLVCPDHRFQDEQEDERIVLLLRSHPITNIRWIFGLAFLAVIPTFFIAFGITALFPLKFVFIGQSAWYLILFGVAFNRFLQWYYSVLIVTNERVVDIDFDGGLRMKRAHAALNKIEEKTLIQGGLVRSIFRFGTVDVSTAAEMPSVQIVDVPNPEKVLQIIDELTEELETRRKAGE